MAKILIIDDEEQLRKLLARIIALEGYEVAEAADCAGGLRMLRRYEPDVVLCDVKLPDGNGVEMVERIKQAMPSAEVILLTAYGNIPDGVQAIKNGAFDYITKGDDNNKILPLLSRATEKAQMQRRLARLEDKLSEEHSFDRIIGSSESLRSAVALARKVAVTDTSVLLTGETGTGKEVFAQAIHHASPRAKGAFVAVNCSAFSKELLESELFGHRAGSFTGATKDKKGLFEEADKGTLFLDEIGEMPVELQAKLLRVLECGEFIKIGETRPTKVDLRIIAATNRDLEKPTRTCARRSPRGISAKTSSSDFLFSASTCRRCANGRAISLNMPGSLRRNSPTGWGAGSTRSTRDISPHWNAMPGTATSANCATSWSAA